MVSRRSAVARQRSDLGWEPEARRTVFSVDCRCRRRARSECLAGLDEGRGPRDDTQAGAACRRGGRTQSCLAAPSAARLLVHASLPRWLAGSQPQSQVAAVSRARRAEDGRLGGSHAFPWETRWPGEDLRTANGSSVQHPIRLMELRSTKRRWHRARRHSSLVLTTEHRVLSTRELAT